MSFSAIADTYARDVVKDRRGKHFCRWTRLAAQRYLSDLKRRNWEYTYKAEAVEDVCEFIELLPHVEGTWDTPTIRLAPAQIFILSQVFGWRKPDGTRRFSRVYIEMARKNAKSTLSAAIALYCLCREDEIGPQVLVGATTGEQARRVFDPARKIVLRTPALREAFDVQAWAHGITCGATGGYVRPINAKASTQDGWNPHCAILDELHAHKSRDLYDVLRSAFGSRKNPLLWTITTAGYDTEGVCYEQRTLVTKILEGVIEADHVFGIIYTLDPADLEASREFDERVWEKANPLLGVSVGLEEMRGFAVEAQTSPEQHFEFLTKRLNVWTTAKGAWISLPSWKANDGPVDYEELRGTPCWAAIDLASTSDVTALVVVWDRDPIPVWCRFYVPEDTVAPRTEKASIPYLSWVKGGYLTATPGNITDYAWVKRDLLRLLVDHDVRAIAFDPWNATHLVTELQAEGAPMVEFRQGPKSYHPALQALERAYKSRGLAHGGNPVLNWMASNLVVRRDPNENLAPDKKHSHEKIDGVVALAMALGVKTAGVQITTRSVYEERGVLVFGTLGH